MGVLILIVVAFSGIVFHGVFGVGIMENVLIHVGLIGVPLFIDKFLMSAETEALFEGGVAAWLYWIAYAAIAVAIYYAAMPTIAENLPLRDPATSYRPPPLDGFSLFLAAASLGLVVALPVHSVGVLILDWCGVWKAAMARINGEAYRPRQSYSPGPGTGDDDFAYSGSRFHGGSSAGSHAGGYDAEADYDSALKEAQAWADQMDARAGAAANKFEALARNPSLHPKDKLRYRLAAMLLRERGKVRGGSTGPEPTDDDLLRLGLPVPTK